MPTKPTSRLIWFFVPADPSQSLKPVAIGARLQEFGEMRPDVAPVGFVTFAVVRPTWSGWMSPQPKPVCARIPLNTSDSSAFARPARLFRNERDRRKIVEKSRSTRNESTRFWNSMSQMPCSLLSNCSNNDPPCTENAMFHTSEDAALGPATHRRATLAAYEAGDRESARGSGHRCDAGHACRSTDDLRVQGDELLDDALDVRRRLDERGLGVAALQHRDVPGNRRHRHRVQPGRHDAVQEVRGQVRRVLSRPTWKVHAGSRASREQTEARSEVREDPTEAGEDELRRDLETEGQRVVPEGRIELACGYVQEVRDRVRQDRQSFRCHVFRLRRANVRVRYK